MYKLTKPIFENETTSVVNIQTNSLIPFDEQNSDYIAYLAWLELGNTPLPAENT
jgi:hypothetical protein